MRFLWLAPQTECPSVSLPFISACAYSTSKSVLIGQKDWHCVQFYRPSMPFWTVLVPVLESLCLAASGTEGNAGSLFLRKLDLGPAWIHSRSLFSIHFLTRSYIAMLMLVMACLAGRCLQMKLETWVRWCHSGHESKRRQKQDQDEEQSETYL